MICTQENGVHLLVVNEANSSSKSSNRRFLTHTGSPSRHKVGTRSPLTGPTAMPSTSSPVERPPSLRDHLATLRRQSPHRMDSQAKSATGRPSYFLKSLLCSSLFRSDSMSLSRVSFSLRSWKSRKEEREDTDYGEGISSDENSSGPPLHQPQRGGGGGQGTQQGVCSEEAGRGKPSASETRKAMAPELRRHPPPEHPSLITPKPHSEGPNARSACERTLYGPEAELSWQGFYRETGAKWEISP